MAGRDRKTNARLHFVAEDEGDRVADEEEQISIQQRYQDVGNEVGHTMMFDDAIKDIDAGIEAVNEWLKPRAASIGVELGVSLV